VASTRSDSVSGRLRAHVITAMHSSADERALVRTAFVGFAPAYRSARRTAGGSHLRAVRLRHLLGMGPASSKARGPAGAIGRVGQWPLFVMPAYGPLAMLDLAPGRTPPKPSRRSAAGAVCPRPDPPQACTGIRRAQPAHTGAHLLHAEESDARVAAPSGGSRWWRGLWCWPAAAAPEPAVQLALPHRRHFQSCSHRRLAPQRRRRIPLLRLQSGYARWSPTSTTPISSSFLTAANRDLRPNVKRSWTVTSHRKPRPRSKRRTRTQPSCGAVLPGEFSRSSGED
jgi:hypothetical protein